MNPATAYAYNYFVNKGWTPVQASGIIGNLQAESGLTAGLNPGGDNGTARGLAQWRGSRLAGLYDYAKTTGADPASLDTQLAYVHHELNTTEGRAGAALRAATTVPDATAAVIGYERPAGWSTFNPTGGHSWAGRLANAQQVAGMPVDPNAPAPVAQAAQADSPGTTAVVQPAGAGDDIALRLALMQQSPIASMFGPSQQNLQAQAQAEAEHQARRRALITGGGLASLYG